MRNASPSSLPTPLSSLQAILSLKKPHVFLISLVWSWIWASQFVTTARMILVCKQGWEPLSTSVQIKSYWYSFLWLPFTVTFLCSFVVSAIPCAPQWRRDPAPLKHEPLHQKFASLSLSPSTGCVFIHHHSLFRYFCSHSTDSLLPLHACLGAL